MKHLSSRLLRNNSPYLEKNPQSRKPNYKMAKEQEKRAINEEEIDIDRDYTRRDYNTMKDETKAQLPRLEILTITEARRRLISWERASSYRKKKEKIVK